MNEDNIHTGCGGGLHLRCMGSKDDDGLLPVAVYCDACPIEGPIRRIQYANQTQEVWDAFWEAA